ncbi:MAG: 16S rRNA (guanine(527)-N(7))-methyltransferase RsmG [Pseudohongiellaceae bacterium]
MDDPQSGRQSRSRLRVPLEQGLSELDLSADGAQLDKLLDYIDLLARWNRTFNLSGIRNPGDIISRHILDSLTLSGFLRDATVLDIGSGAGLPGIPLAIMRPSQRFVLLDSNGKKTRFLFQAKLALGLDNVAVENCRAEHYQSEDQIDIVTCRALSSLSHILDLSGALLTPGVRLLAMKGRMPEQELTRIPREFEVIGIHAVDVPGLDQMRHIIEIRRPDGDTPVPDQSDGKAAKKQDSAT